MSTRSLDKSDTIDLVERGLASRHGRESSRAQRARAVLARRVLDMPRRRARSDELADLVVQDEQLRNRLAPPIADAAAFAAAPHGAEAKLRGLLCSNAGILQQLRVRIRGLGARRTSQPHQALR